MHLGYCRLQYQRSLASVLACVTVVLDCGFAVGWVGLPLPDEATFKQLTRRSNVKIAQKFLTGWELATYKKKVYGQKHQHEPHLVRFNTDGVAVDWYLPLVLSEYGTSSMWLLVQKELAK